MDVDNNHTDAGLGTQRHLPPLVKQATEAIFQLQQVKKRPVHWERKENTKINTLKGKGPRGQHGACRRARRAPELLPT